jgi:hypothetical protein
VNNNGTRGNNIIVALSSIQVTLGTSPATVRGARNKAARKGVENRVTDIIQTEYETTSPTIIAAFIPFFALFTSPIIGSTKVNPQIKGIVYFPASNPSPS